MGLSGQGWESSAGASGEQRAHRAAWLVLPPSSLSQRIREPSELGRSESRRGFPFYVFSLSRIPRDSPGS